MTPEPAEASTVSEIYELLRRAAIRRQPVAATYDGLLRLLCPHVGGPESQVDGMSSAISSEGRVILSGHWYPRAAVSGVASPWSDSAKSSGARTHGTPSHAPKSRPALMKSISTSMLSPETTRKKGSEAVAAAAGAPERCAASRSSADYAARGVRGDPRGRKSGAGAGATNPR